MTAKNEIAKKLIPMSGESNVKSYADGRSPPVCSEGQILVQIQIINPPRTNEKMYRRVEKAQTLMSNSTYWNTAQNRTNPADERFGPLRILSAFLSSSVGCQLWDSFPLSEKQDHSASPGVLPRDHSCSPAECGASLLQERAGGSRSSCHMVI